MQTSLPCGSVTPLPDQDRPALLIGAVSVALSSLGRRRSTSSGDPEKLVRSGFDLLVNGGINVDRAKLSHNPPKCGPSATIRAD